MAFGSLCYGFRVAMLWLSGRYAMAFRSLWNDILSYACAHARRVKPEIRVIQRQMSVPLVGKSTAKSTTHTGEAMTSPTVGQVSISNQTFVAVGIIALLCAGCNQVSETSGDNQPRKNMVVQPEFHDYIVVHKEEYSPVLVTGMDPSNRTRLCEICYPTKQGSSK